MSLTDFLHGVETVTVDSGARTIQTIRSSVIGLIYTAPAADAVKFPLNVPILFTKRGETAGMGLTGTGPDAFDGIYDSGSNLVVGVRVAEGANVSETTANVIGGVDVNGDFAGLHALRAAESFVGVAPMLFCAPGSTHQRTSSAANAVAAEFLGLAEEMRAHVILDGPSTTDAAAIAYAGDFGSRRLFLVDPHVTGFSAAAKANRTGPASARVAGHIGRIDAAFGFWESPSNKEMLGVIGVDRPIDSIGANSRANILNSNRVATVVRDQGFRLWGNRTLSSDPKYSFLSISRTCDMIDVSIAKAHRWAVDRGITRTYFDDVSSSVNAYLRKLRRDGAIVGGECWVDPEDNTPDQISAGHATFSYAFSGVYPAERVTFKSALVDTYLTDIFA